MGIDSWRLHYALDSFLPCTSDCLDVTVRLKLRLLVRLEHVSVSFADRSRPLLLAHVTPASLAARNGLSRAVCPTITQQPQTDDAPWSADSRHSQPHALSLLGGVAP
jgi:hypothetical protein